MTPRDALRLAAAALAVGLTPAPAPALVAVLSSADVEEALEVGRAGVTQEDFGEEWRIRLPGGEEIVVTTPFSQLAHAARQAAFRGEVLTDRQRQEQLDRGRGRILLLVTMYGSRVDFARWYQPTLQVGDRVVKATLAQNERTALSLEERRFAARNLYVFPIEGLPPRGAVTLVVQHSVERREVLRARLDLAKMR